MNKHLERLLTGSVVIATIALIAACIWFLIEIRILHWLVLFTVSSWVIGTIVKKWGFKDDKP